MRNYDEKRALLANDFVQALKSDNEESVQRAMVQFSEGIAQIVLAEANQKFDALEASILSSRGVRVLTPTEHNYYTKVIEAMKSKNPRQALTDIELTFPETVFETVLEDIQTNFPLLNAIDFVNTTAVTKFIYNKQGAQLAQWGPLGAAFEKELSGAFGVIDVTMCTLKAYFPVPKDFLNLGPVWLDRYVRAVLVEANALALEMGIVDGTGKDMPIGMTRSVADDVSVTGGEYPRKDAVTLTSLDSKAYHAIVSTLTQTPSGRARPVTRVALICNPADYLKVVRPSVTMLTTAGNYAENVFPFPTDVYQTAALEDGKAIIGLPKKYFMGMGTSRNGVIEYDDSVKFLDDVRVYATRLYGNGRPKDDYAFVLVDISNMEATYPTVYTKTKA